MIPEARPSPFCLDNPVGYRDWRARKLANYPRSIEAVRVRVRRLAEPSAAELAAIGARIARCNMALIDCGDPAQVEADALLRLGEHLGLRRTDHHLCADANAVSTIRVAGDGRAGELIPYTNRPLNWHTDGYYNPPRRAVRAWLLFCRQDAVAGGENALLDHEIAYLRLRDQEPELIRALLDPQTLGVPANEEAGADRREAIFGPVFSWPQGALEMRYTARARHAIWPPTPAVTAAREALTRLFSGNEGFIYRHKLRPGEGYITNNVLHNRSGFDANGAERTLLRVRYLDRVSI
ncbi:TauD/TfdA family dioxygenase [Thiococcus pfennigii]|uniref:TauD/TfdA family dioxygenase n=1 Tax=Thiococcus pfennigii TaxID=1057 RepID=UPI001908835D|nr:TauD/TfdA family dioxygenase [Thiococcus pfennigii]MBK1700373.1 hypothetical protein [Thiococcus pfennigii]MBK1732334.1 hypothetical protein [Thiococcus pfennigii]